MAQKKDFQITSPRGRVFTVTGKNGSVTAKLEWAPGFAQKRAEGFSRAQAFVDSECLRYMNPLTPRRTRMLIKSGTLGTVIGSGSIEYLAPYARRAIKMPSGKELRNLPDSKRKTIIESIREYMRMYPDIDNRKINIDRLGNGMEYSIDPIGADPIYKRYVDGSCLKQFQFALTSKEAYDGDARTGIANSGFYQNFEEWTEQNNLNDIVPELDGHDAIRVEVLQSGYLFSTEVDLGRYQMICRLIYK